MDDQTQTLPSDDEIVKRQAQITSGNAAQPMPLVAGAPPMPSDDEIVKRQAAIRNEPLPVSTPKAAPLAPVSPIDSVSVNSQVGGADVPVPASNGPAIPTPSIPTSQDVHDYLNQPVTPGFQRSTVLPIAVNPDIHNMGGVQFDPRGPINGLLNLIGDNSPAAVAQRGNITPEMALALLGSKAGNPLSRNMPITPFSVGTGMSAADRAAMVARSDSQAAPLSPSFTSAPMAPNPLYTTPVAGDVSRNPNPLTGGVQPPTAPTVPPVNFTGAANLDPAAVKPSQSTAGAMQTPANQVPTYTATQGDEARELARNFADRVPSGVDLAEHLPGEQRTVGQTDIKLAPMENVYRDTHQQVYDKVDTAQKALVNGTIEKLAGDPEDIAELTTQRGAQMDAERAQVWKGKTNNADVTPISRAVDSLLASGIDVRPAVSKGLQSIKDSLFDKDGVAKTDPQVLSHAYDNVTDILDKTDSEERGGKLAQSMFLGLRDQLAQAIDKSAPGFMQSTKNFAENSRRINEMTVLQKELPKMKSSGDITPEKFNASMQRIYNGRWGSDPTNPARSISDQTMQTMFATRRLLQTLQASRKYAESAGSPTFKKTVMAAGTGALTPVLRNALTYGSAAAGHAINHSLGGGIAGQVGQLGLESMILPRIHQNFAARAARGQDVVANQLTLSHPDYEGSTTNRLTQAQYERLNKVSNRADRR